MKNYVLLMIVVVFSMLFLMFGCCGLTDNGSGLEKGWIDTDNDGIADLYNGDNEFSFIMFDSDGNQNGMAGLYDRDKDGMIDAILLDTNNDENYDTGYFDNNHDGKVDMWAVTINSVISYAYDMTGDGIPDVYDSDGDGTYDAWDLDNDGTIDERDVDNDGVVDLHDNDFNGVFDELEQ